MINDALSVIVSELNNHIKLWFQLKEDKVVLSSIIEIDGSFATKNIDKLAVSLIGIEEETVIRNNNGSRMYSTAQANINPALNINLHVLCSASFNDYLESLKFISGALAFFQNKNVFTHSNSPGLSSNVERLVVELENTNYQDMSYIWGMLGSKYLPCVLYKIRMLAIQEGNWKGTTPLVTTVEQTGKN